MNTTQAPIHPAILLACLLDRMDTSGRPLDALQYQLVAGRLGALLTEPGVPWQPLLERSTAAAMLYENLHYAEAGLCCSPLHAAMRAEVAARAAVETARRKSAPRD